MITSFAGKMLLQLDYISDEKCVPKICQQLTTTVLLCFIISRSWKFPMIKVQPLIWLFKNWLAKIILKWNCFFVKGFRWKIEKYFSICKKDPTQMNHSSMCRILNIEHKRIRYVLQLRQFDALLYFFNNLLSDLFLHFYSHLRSQHAIYCAYTWLSQVWILAKARHRMTNHNYWASYNKKCILGFGKKFATCNMTWIQTSLIFWIKTSMN